MTTQPNKFERAGRLLAALAKVDAAELAAHEAVNEKHAAKRAALLDGAENEVRAMVAEELTRRG